MFYVLAIESSCDETAAAVVAAPSVAAAASCAAPLTLVSNELSTQAHLHGRYGGVVPEVASREHLAALAPLIEAATRPIGGVRHLHGIAVTAGPGLLGALLVGLQCAKALALTLEVPWLGVHHLEGHLSAVRLLPKPPAYPHLALLVSGGHTQMFAVREFGAYELIGQTRDDAAGEAFDKVAKLLGLGYPGGARLAAAAVGGEAHGVALPRALPGRNCFDFSFSGLKTAARRAIEAHTVAHGGPPEGMALRTLCASVQEAICDVLSRKAVAAAQASGLRDIVLAGGVAANARLRELLLGRASAAGIGCTWPPPPLCTDNAAMIGAAGLPRLAAGERSPSHQSAASRWALASLRPPLAPPQRVQAGGA